MSAVQSPLSFHIEPQANVLDGITLYEPVERALLVKLINSTLLRETFNNNMAGALYKTEKQQLERYLGMMENGRIPITYTRNENNPYGRCNPANALGLFPTRRELRHTIACQRMVDLDVKNCHPEMLNQICAVEGAPHAELNDYVKNRQTYFDRLVENYGCSEEAAKTAFIIYSYGGGFKKWLEKAEIDVALCDPAVVKDGAILELHLMREFREAMTPIHKRIARANPHLCSIVRALKKARGIDSYNLEGTVCSFVLQEYEVRVLEQLFLHCSNNNLIEDGVCVLCADGLMIEHRFYDAALLTTFADITKRALGFDLVFTQKEMAKGYNAILDKSLCFDLYTPTYTTGLIADHFATMNSNKFMCNDGAVYQYNGVSWDALDAKNSALHLYIDDKFYKYMVGYCAVQLTAQNAALALCEADEACKAIEAKILRISGLLKDIQMLRKNKARKELVEDIINQITNNHIVFDNSPHLFAFKNRVYDLKTNAFVSADYAQYIKTTCGYDHSPYYPAEKVQTLRALIDTIFPDPAVRDYYLTALASGLYGQQVEACFIATGSGGNGKSLINALMMDCVGDYGYKLGSNVLLDEIKEGANPAIASLDRKRFVLVQEPNSRRRICSATLKEITGDKVINARMNYSNECKTQLHLTLVMECNELPELDEVGNGIQRRMRAIPFVSRFVPADTYHALEDKTGVALANPYYKTPEFQQQHRQALFEILRPRWEVFQANECAMPDTPPECKKITSDYLAASDDIYEWFCEKYVKGDPETDMVFVDDLHKNLTSSPIWLKMSKADQRKNNKAKFEANVTKNIFLQQFYKPKDAYFQKVRIKRPFLVGFKEAPEEDTEEL